MVDASAICAACTQAWPDVKLAPAIAHERLAATPLGSDAHLADVGLAWAALAGDAAALRVLDKLIRAEAQRAAAELRKPAHVADEVQQELAQKLLVGPAPKLAQYTGQSALGRWLGVAALRTALNLARGAKAERDARPLDENADADVIAAFVDPELAVVRKQYRAEVERAIRASFDALDNARDRNLLKLYYLDRVGLDQLGRMFGVHASTVSRWLQTLREAIIDDTNARLSEQLGMQGKYSDVASLIRAVRSDLDVTLSKLLR